MQNCFEMVFLLLLWLLPLVLSGGGGGNGDCDCDSTLLSGYSFPIDKTNSTFSEWNAGKVIAKMVKKSRARAHTGQRERGREREFEQYK